MMTQLTPILFRPVFEAPWFQDRAPWPWPIADVPAFRSIVLGHQMTDLEVGSMVAALCSPLEVKENGGSSAILNQLCELDSLSLSGGLEVVSDSKVLISHGCCSGVEEWQELRDMLKGESPWMGHDPAPWCEYPKDNTVRLWSDGALGEEYLEPGVTLSMNDVQTQLTQFHCYLREAATRFDQWLVLMEYASADCLVEKFRHSFKISPNEALGSAE